MEEWKRWSIDCGRCYALKCEINTIHIRWQKTDDLMGVSQNGEVVADKATKMVYVS